MRMNDCVWLRLIHVFFINIHMFLFILPGIVALCVKVSFWMWDCVRTFGTISLSRFWVHAHTYITREAGTPTNKFKMFAPTPAPKAIINFIIYRLYFKISGFNYGPQRTKHSNHLHNMFIYNLKQHPNQFKTRQPIIVNTFIETKTRKTRNQKS